MKHQRQQAIVDIITTQGVETQEELLEILAKQGYSTTQATISRDIKELSLIKELREGTYRYSLPHRKPHLAGGMTQIFREGVVSVVAAQNIVVLKTLPGLAMAACTALDDMDILGKVGTLAGDDTCIMIMTENATAEKFIDDMKGVLL